MHISLMHIRRFAGVVAMLVVAAVAIPAQEQQEEQDQPEEQQQQEREIPSGVDGWVALENIGRHEWRIADSGGTGVYATAGSVNVGLEVGNTYYFDLSVVDSDHIPFAVVGLSGDILLSQDESVEQTAPDGINAEIDGDGIQFELTEEFAERVARFRALPYPSMVGFISASGLAEETEEESQQESGSE